MNDDPKDTKAEASRLFREAMSGVKPLNSGSTFTPQTALDRDRKRLRLNPQEHRKPLPQYRNDWPMLNPSREWKSSGVQEKRLKALRSGKIRWDRRLDLHGYRAEQALLCLQSEISVLLKDQARYWLIIHGKGIGSVASEAVIRPLVLDWLLKQPAVLAFVTAPQNQGGDGATAVLLQRQSQS